MKKFEIGKITQLTEDKSNREKVQKRNLIGFHSTDKPKNSDQRLDRLGFSGKLIEKEKPNKTEEKTGLKDDEEQHIVRSEN